MQGDTSVRLLELTENSIYLECIVKKHHQRRRIVIEEQAIHFEDESDYPVSLPDISNIWITAGYGKLLRRNKNSRANKNGYIDNGKMVEFENSIPHSK